MTTVWVSGSTGVACINTNRNFIGMELDVHYFTVSQERISETAEKANREIKIRVGDMIHD